jgi:hypothetical protein
MIRPSPCSRPRALASHCAASRPNAQAAGPPQVSTIALTRLGRPLPLRGVASVGVETAGRKSGDHSWPVDPGSRRQQRWHRLPLHEPLRVQRVGNWQRLTARFMQRRGASALHRILGPRTDEARRLPAYGVSEGCNPFLSVNAFLQTKASMYYYRRP